MSKPFEYYQKGLHILCQDLMDYMFVMYMSCHTVMFVWYKKMTNLVSLPAGPSD